MMASVLGCRRATLAAIAALFGLLNLPLLAQTPPDGQDPPPALSQTPSTDRINLPPGQIPPDVGTVEYEEASIVGSRIKARNVRVTVGEYTLRGGELEGDLERELVFTGNPSLTFRGQVLTGDRILFSPKAKTFRVENLHTALTPDFLQGRLLSPLYLSAGSISGRRRDPIIGMDLDATTCELSRPDYLVRAGEVIVEPEKRVVLKRATFILWGVRLVTLPVIVIPLDQRLRRPRADYLPEFGRSQEEGWFVKAALSYLLADRAPGLYRVDLMEKKGIGLGVEQNWSLTRWEGAFAIYAIPTGGTSRNLSGRVSNRLSLGGGQLLSLDNDFQQNSYLSLPQTTNFHTRLGYQLQTGGINVGLNLTRMATDTEGFRTRSYSASLSQSYPLGKTGSISFSGDYSRFSSVTLPSEFNPKGAFQRTEQLHTRMQADQRGDNYLLQFVANKSIPVGKRVGQSFFSGVEKIPEITLSNYRFRRGYLSTLPLTFSLSFGQYSEGGSLFGQQPSTKTTSERVIVGLDAANLRYPLSRSTQLSINSGFQQYFYGEGAAQYVIRSNATLTQQWNRRSGINFTYAYQRPRGGTPFRFDQLGQYHTLNTDIGFLDDSRLQLTARIGYDFAQSGFGGFRQPWQTLAINLLARPAPWARLQNLLSYDPNNGRMQNIISDLRFRGRNDFSLDMVARYDPVRHKFGNINSYVNLPIGNLWRVVALLQYNGYLKRFESRNIQVVRDLHCLEASLTYIDNPFGYRNDRQIYFQVRIKAIPIFQRFGTGQFGQAIDTGIGGFN
jgi:hypothetical protein